MIDSSPSPSPGASPSPVWTYSRSAFMWCGKLPDTPGGERPYLRVMRRGALGRTHDFWWKFGVNVGTTILPAVFGDAHTLEEAKAAAEAAYVEWINA